MMVFLLPVPSKHGLREFFRVLKHDVGHVGGYVTDAGVIEDWW